MLHGAGEVKQHNGDIYTTRSCLQNEPLRQAQPKRVCRPSSGPYSHAVDADHARQAAPMGLTHLSLPPLISQPHRPAARTSLPFPPLLSRLLPVRRLAVAGPPAHLTRGVLPPRVPPALFGKQTAAEAAWRAARPGHLHSTRDLVSNCSCFV